METRKVLARSRRRMNAAGSHAPAHRRSLIARLSREAATSPDPVRAAAAAAAVEHFREHGWSDASWGMLGVARRKRRGRRVGRLQ
jgi:hypothetical protein